MDTENLKCFLTVVSCESFTRAADKLFVTQSTVSRRISRLEEEFGVQLIERSAPVFRLTSAGEYLWSNAPNVLLAFKQLSEGIRGINGSMQGSARIGCYGMIPLTLVSEIRKYMSEQHAQVELNFYFGRIRCAEKDLAEGSRDLLLAPSLGLPFDDDYVRGTVIKRQRTVILSVTHPLAKRQYLSVNDLRGEPIIYWAEHMIPSVYKALFSACAKAGFAPNIVETYERMDSILFAVHAGHGLTIHFNNASTYLDEGLIELPIPDLDLAADVDFLYPKDNSNPVLPLLLDCLEMIAVTHP